MENNPFIDDFPSYKHPFIIDFPVCYVKEPDVNNHVPLYMKWNIFCSFHIFIHYIPIYPPVN